jgi:hypothetical protein
VEPPDFHHHNKQKEGEADLTQHPMEYYRYDAVELLL